MDLQQLARRPTVTVPDDAEIWDLTSEEAGVAIKTLGADTARHILATLYEQPQTASELAEATENSLQNVNYHLNNLRDAGLIEVADTRYSQKGTEMKIYTPTTNAVLLLSQESTAAHIKRLLSRLVAGVGALAIGAIAFRYAVYAYLEDFGTEEDQPFATRTDDDVMELQADTATTAHPLEELPLFLDPGVVFFFGGLLVLLFVLALFYLRERHQVTNPSA